MALFGPELVMFNSGKFFNNSMIQSEECMTCLNCYRHLQNDLFLFLSVSVTLQVLYKLKTAKIFEKPKKREDSRNENRDSVGGDNQKNGGDSLDPDPLAVYLIHLCTESRILCFAGATHLVLCKFSKQELNVEVQVW